MNFIKTLFKETNQTLKDNNILIQPLILYLIAILVILMPISEKLANPHDSTEIIKTLLIGLVCIILINVVFNAGWYNMLYTCIKTPINPNLNKSEQALKSLELFKAFFPGVALFFNRYLAGTLLYFAIILIIGLGAYSYGMENIGAPVGISWDIFSDPNQTYESMQNYILNLPDGIKLQIAQWELLIFAALISTFIINYLSIFWPQMVIVDNINPIRAFINSFKEAFKHPLRVLIIALSFAFCLKICFIIFSIPFILFPFVGIIIYVFTVSYFNLMIFKYLDTKQTPNNNSRSDSIGQN
ncbi:MAG: hypothetical protein AB7V50_05630 [Vampirovibrionia bacterium]